MTKIIRIGNQTAFSAAAPLDPWHYAIEQGFDAFEWFSDRKYSDDGNGTGWDETVFTEQQCDKIKQQGLAHDISHSIHTPWQANPLHADGYPLLKRSIDFAHRIGAHIVNLHLYMEAGAQAYVDALIPVIEYAQDKQVRLSIENTTLTSPDDFNDTFSCFRRSEIQGDQVGMCLDIGHANLCSATHNDFVKFIDQLDENLPIIHLHVHENWGDKDNHLALFTGPAGENDAGVYAFVKRMEKRGFNGAMIMEQWPQPAEILVQARERLQAMLSSPVIPEKLSKQSSRQARTETKKKVKKQLAEKDKKKITQPANEIKEKTSEESQAVATSATYPDFQQQSLLAAIIETHQQLSSWRQRLEWVRDQVVADTFQALPEQLIPYIVYLRFLATGELSCQEDGRHFRPNHHARAAMDLENMLKAHTTENNAWLMRRLYPWLPSYDEAYQRSEPLTRIRDIAHRNDIPKDLKNEIKHQLQNKLHRCAGPEDLVTSRNILQRVTAPDTHYSVPFVEQFQIFHRELEEFFNATALDQRLASLDVSNDTKLAECLHQFGQLKAISTPGNDDVIELLRHLTLLRRFLYSLQEKIQNKSEAAQSQRIRMSDIALEDFAFSQFSDAINRLVPPPWDSKWRWPLELSVLILENITLSFIEQDEARSLIDEINYWRKNINVKDPYELLRLRASLQRALRLAETYVDQMLNLFPPIVSSLGHALGVAEHAINMYCEGDIRANLVFQLSRLIELVQMELDATLNLSPWETVVPGMGIGQFIRVKNLHDIKQVAKPMVVWLDQADGDENIPDYVCGLILNHSLPHLSHLAVRARQLKVPFTVARRSSANIELTKLIDQQVRVEIKADELIVNSHSASIKKSSTVQSETIIKVPLAELSQSTDAIKLEQTTVTNSGGKAAGAKSLLQLAKSSENHFEVPFGLALPFGFMQAMMQKTPTLIKQYQTLQQTISTTSSESLGPLLEQIQSVVFDIKIPKNVLEPIKKHFNGVNLLAVRSSSNCEDQEDFSGAGLHDSVLGVNLDQLEHGIKQVWASLWNRRAVLARLQANVPHHEVHMAILIQTMVHPEWSFIMHTSNPYADQQKQNTKSSTEPNTMIVEIAMGLGETLASANEPGSPYRLSYERDTKKTAILSMANYSFSLLPNQHKGLERKRLNYSNLALSNDTKHLITIGKRLGAVADYLEHQLGRAQDVEGCYANDTVYIVQTRAQQGL